MTVPFAVTAANAPDSVPVPATTTHPTVAEGSFGAVTALNRPSGGARITGLGPDAVSIVPNGDGSSALAVIEAGKLVAGAGAVAFLPDSQVFLDSSEFGLSSSPSNQSLLFNCVVFAAVVPPAANGDDREFFAPAGDYSRLLVHANGTATRMLRDGSLIQFDASGRQTSAADRNGNTTTFTYDGAGRLTRLTDPGNRHTDFVYADGFLERVTDPAGRVSVFMHDPTGNLTQVLMPDGGLRLYSYDNRHLLIGETNGRGNSSTHQFNSIGQAGKSSGAGKYHPHTVVRLCDRSGRSRFRAWHQRQSRTGYPPLRDGEADGWRRTHPGIHFRPPRQCARSNGCRRSNRIFHP